MKRVTFLAAFVCLLVATSFVSAQDGMKSEMKGEMPAVSYVMHYEEIVDPAHMMDYEQGTAMWVKAIMEAEIGLTFSTYNYLNHYAYVVTFDDFSKMNKLAMKWSKAVGLLRDSEWGNKRQAAVISSEYTIWMHDPQLSYTPAEQKLDPSKMAFMEIFEMTTTYEHENAFRAELKEWKNWDKMAAFSKGYDVYRNIIGKSGPRYAIVSYEESAATYFAEGEKFYMENMEEVMQMRMKMGKVMTGMDSTYARTRPDISIMHMGEEK